MTSVVLKAKSGNASAPYRLTPKLHEQVKEFLAQKEFLFDLVNGLGSPLNILHPQIFREKYQLFEDLLRDEQLSYRVYFTCKPNRSQALLKEAASLNAYVDVSSIGEMQAALGAGIPGSRISATGPKNQAYLDLALFHGAMLVLDSPHDFNYVRQHAKQPHPVMFRLSTPQDGHMQDDTFGFDLESLQNIFPILQSSENLEFQGFSCHYSGAFDNMRIKHIEQLVVATLKAFEFDLTPQAVNIGGGYKISHVSGNNDWQDFMSSLKKAILGDGQPVTWDNAGMGLRLQDDLLTGTANFIDHYESTTGENHLQKILFSPLKSLEGASFVDFIRDTGLTLYIEPGRAMLDQCGLTIAKVNFTKRSAKGEYLVNLNMNHTNMNAHAFKYMAEPIVLKSPKNSLSNKNAEGVYYYGSLCFAHDLITFHKTYPDDMPEAGDLVIFANTAAYRMDFAESETLRHPVARKAAVYIQNNRWRWALDEEYKETNL